MPQFEIGWRQAVWGGAVRRTAGRHDSIASCSAPLVVVLRRNFVRPHQVCCLVKMPGGHTAIVDRQKLTGYGLNPEHPRGKHKARVFAVFGFTTENADELRAALLAAAADAEQAASDRFGDRYVIEFEIRGPRGSGIVRSMWIVRLGESAPRLTSCFVK